MDWTVHFCLSNRTSIEPVKHARTRLHWTWKSMFLSSWKCTGAGTTLTMISELIAPLAKRSVIGWF